MLRYFWMTAGVLKKIAKCVCAIANAVRNDLGRMGFSTNDEKSVWGPC